MKGKCEECGSTFQAELIHNGFNESAFAYCDTCGITGFIDGWRTDIPDSANFKIHGPVTKETQTLLAPCPCGGSFSQNSSPRCPKCKTELSAKLAGSWIEKQSLGTEKGWRWQNAWHGLYAIIVDKKSLELAWAKNAL